MRIRRDIQLRQLQQIAAALALALPLGAAPASAQLSEEGAPQGVAGKPTSPDAAKIAGCKPEQAEAVRAAIFEAVNLLGNRIADLEGEVKSMNASPPEPASDRLKEAMKKHFKIPLFENHRLVAAEFLQVYKGLRGFLAEPSRWPAHFINCEDDHHRCGTGDGTVAYTWPVQGAPSTLCPDFFKMNRRLQAGTMIHEAVHRQVPNASVDDFADSGYYHYSKPTPLTRSQSVLNPDSYANFVVDRPAKAPAKAPK